MICVAESCSKRAKKVLGRTQINAVAWSLGGLRRTRSDMRRPSLPNHLLLGPSKPPLLALLCRREDVEVSTTADEPNPEAQHVSSDVTVLTGAPSVQRQIADLRRENRSQGATTDGAELLVAADPDRSLAGRAPGRPR